MLRVLLYRYKKAGKVSLAGISLLIENKLVHAKSYIYSSLTATMRWSRLLGFSGIVYARTPFLISGST